MKPIWPRQSEFNRFYGNPRGPNGQASAIWESANLVRLIPPFKMTYAGKPIKSFRIHKKCKDSLDRVLKAIWLTADKSQMICDLWGVSIFAGSYNFRLIKGSNTLSNHSWGAAIDLDPVHNHGSLMNFANRPLVRKAFDDEGWFWGGHFDDSMHWECVKR